METSITSSGRKIISSGSFSTFNNEPSIISVVREKEGFEITIIFKEDLAMQQASMKFDTKKDQEKNIVKIEATLINFRGPFASGFIEPIAIGLFDNGDKIHLQINARKLGTNADRYEVNYTIYLEEVK